MGCGETCVKYTLFTLNTVFVLCGLTLIALGSAVLVKISHFDMHQDYIQKMAVAMIIVGCIVFVIAFLGCYGSIKEDACMLMSYAVIMVIMLATKFVLALLLLISLRKVIRLMPKILEKIYEDEIGTFHAIERAIRCCGKKGVDEYSVIPPSCCFAETCTSENAFNVGCIQAIQEFLAAYGFATSFVLIATAAIELVGVVFAVCLFNHVRNKPRSAASLASQSRSRSSMK